MDLNPFGDEHATASAAESDFHYDQDELTIERELSIERELESLMGNEIEFPYDFTVPLMDQFSPVPRLHSSGVPLFEELSPPTSSSEGTGSVISVNTARTTPEPSASLPIEWTNVDLQFLLYILYLYSEKEPAGDFTFSPPLDMLSGPSFTRSLTIQLHRRVPPGEVPDWAYAANQPIGTGRPGSKAIVASSALSYTPQAARRSFAAAFLSSKPELIQKKTAQYGLLSSMFSLSEAALASIKAGMQLMSGTGEEEWKQRKVQMQRGRGVQGAGFYARLELFMLEAGWEKLWTWIGFVETAAGLDDEERARWGATYEAARMWLEKAVKECEGVEEG